MKWSKIHFVKQQKPQEKYLSICSGFVVLGNLGHTTQELFNQENKEIFMNIFTSLLSQSPTPHIMNTCDIRQDSGPTGSPAVGNIFTRQIF